MPLTLRNLTAMFSFCNKSADDINSSQHFRLKNVSSTDQLCIIRQATVYTTLPLSAHAKFCTLQQTFSMEIQ